MLTKLLYNHWVLGRAQFKPWGIKKNSVPYVIKVISPNNIPNLHYITAIETVCSKLKEEDVAELRGEINGIL